MLVALIGIVLLGCDGSDEPSAAGPSAAHADASRAVSPALQARVDAWVDRELPGLLETYRHLHAHPELSLHEEETAATVADALRRAGYAVETGIGGHGVVGVLRNGEGPTLLVRGDMDALPVTEATGLDYASRVRTKNDKGQDVGTMHACGHDVHVTNLIGTAELLASMRDAWQGSVVILAQPAEELGRGALMMIEDGLFERIPAPDHGIALHVAGELPVGRIGFVSGWAAANVDTIEITLHGRGGHGARPHQTVDPIVAGAYLVTQLQTIVSRRIDPARSAVVTVGSFHAGTKSNVIPDEATLALTVRSYEDEVRERLIESITQMAHDTCRLFECPREPTIWIKPDHTPALYNDPELTERAVAELRGLVGAENVQSIPATMTGEDFARYSRRGGFPTFLYRLGSVDPERWRASRAGGDPLPSLHSSRYAPDIEPTLRLGLRSMGRLSLDLLGSGR
jgi:hippurate hydrolase